MINSMKTDSKSVRRGRVPVLQPTPLPPPPWHTRLGTHKAFEGFIKCGGCIVHVYEPRNKDKTKTEAVLIKKSVRWGGGDDAPPVALICGWAERSQA